MTTQNQNRNTNNLLTALFEWIGREKKGRCNRAIDSKLWVRESKSRAAINTRHSFMGEMPVGVPVSMQQIKFVVFNPIFIYSFGCDANDTSFYGRIRYVRVCISYMPVFFPLSSFRKWVSGKNLTRTALLFVIIFILVCGSLSLFPSWLFIVCVRISFQVFFSFVHLRHCLWWAYYVCVCVYISYSV